MHTFMRWRENSKAVRSRFAPSHQSATIPILMVVDERRSAVSDWAFTCSCALALLPAFVVLKLLLVLDNNRAITPPPGLIRSIGYLGLALHRDALFTIALAGATLCILVATRRSPPVHTALRILFLVVHAIVVFWVIGTYFVWEVVFQLITIDLYRLSGGIFAFDPGVSSGIWRALPWTLGSVAMFLGLQTVLARKVPFDRLRISSRRRQFAILFFIPLLGLLTVGVKFRRDRTELRETPVAFFLTSWASEPEDFGAGEVVTLDEKRLFGPAASTSATATARVAAPQKKNNVIFVVLESIGARYLHAFGGKWENSPNLDAMTNSGLFFTNAYAHSPLTNEAALTLQCSVYPRTGPTITVGRRARFQGSDLAGELQSHGYRTAFMCQTLLGWQGKDFLKDRHFDVYHEMYEYFRDWGGNRRMDDRTLLPGAFEWIDAVREQGMPFFLMLWTYQGHYPCYAADPPQPLAPEHPALNRYLNAIREEDRLLGLIMEELKARNLADSTLVVVVGDHGQAFSSVSSERAARDLTDYSIRIPLVFLNPMITQKTGRDDRLARQIDIPPTILDLLGFASPPEWQGVSLISGPRAEMVLLTNSYQRPVTYGLIDGTYKYVTDGHAERLYDIHADPEHTHNLAHQQRDLCRQYHDVLVGWHRYQPNYLERFVPSL
jgi:arylsulfatase A-like enzyme